MPLSSRWKLCKCGARLLKPLTLCSVRAASRKKGPPALSPGTDPPSIERVLLGRGGLPVLAFHLNQATSTNKALIINAFTEWNTMPPPPSLSPVPAKMSQKIDGATLFDVTMGVLKPIIGRYTFSRSFQPDLTYFHFLQCAAFVLSYFKYNLMFFFSFFHCYSIHIDSNHEWMSSVNLDWIQAGTHTVNIEFRFQ